MKFKIHKINKHLTCISVMVALGTTAAFAQIDPLGSQFYQNRYLSNPAFAGIGEGLTFNISHRNQLNGIKGAPVTQALTGEYRVNRVGLGLNLHNDKAGLLRRTRAVATYAYHLPLNEEQQLSFGLSVGIMGQRLAAEDIDGQTGDSDVGDYNARGISADGDFGAAYTFQGLTLQAALPGIGRFVREEDRHTVNHTTIYSAVSYKIALSTDEEGTVIEPMLGYREIKGMSDFWEAGVHATFLENQLSVTAMYHNSRNATFGMGYNFRNKAMLQVLYTSATKALQGIRGNRMEISLKVPVRIDQ